MGELIMYWSSLQCQKTIYTEQMIEYAKVCKAKIVGDPRFAYKRGYQRMQTTKMKQC